MDHAHGIVLDTFNTVAQTNSTTVPNYSAPPPGLLSPGGEEKGIDTSTFGYYMVGSLQLV